MDKKQRLEAYKVARQHLENRFHTDGLCWTLANYDIKKEWLHYPGTITSFICQYYPEIALFKPDGYEAWWFGVPRDRIDERRIQRLIVLDFCIAMLS